MAKYEEEKKTLELLRSRQNNGFEELNKGIVEESSIIENLEKEKQAALLSGSQETFLNIAEKLRTSKDSLEFYTRRKETLKESSRIKESEILEFSRKVRQQQDRLNRDSLKWLYEELRGTVSVLAEVERELSEGDRTLSEGLELYRKDVSESEYKNTLRKIPGFEEQQESINYPERSISTLLNTLRGHIDYLNQDSMKKWVEDLWEKEEKNYSENMFS